MEENKVGEDIAGYNFTDPKFKNSEEDDDEGVSSDFQPEEEKHGCMAVSARSLSGCIFGSPDMPDDLLGDDVKKPNGLFGTKSFP